MAKRTFGRTARVYEALKGTHGEFRAFDFHVPGLEPKQVAGACHVLARKGIIKRGELAGYYVMPNGHDKSPTALKPSTMSPAQAIYDLLDFMAKAEAPLKRAARILEAVDGAQ